LHEAIGDFSSLVVYYYLIGLGDRSSCWCCACRRVEFSKRFFLGKVSYALPFSGFVQKSALIVSKLIELRGLAEIFIA
jgi:hypothetical protein